MRGRDRLRALRNDLPALLGLGERLILTLTLTLIGWHFLASVSEDAVYRTQTATIEIAGERFTAEAAVCVARGWYQVAYIYIYTHDSTGASLTLTLIEPNPNPN